MSNPSRRSSAIWLALVFGGLVAYASLYPFSGWRWPADLSWWQLLALPYPPWRDRFDIAANLLGYAPLGLLICVAGVRSRGRLWWVLPLALACGSLLSFSMEVAQQFLPGRYPSALDWQLNSAGTLAGALLGAVLHACKLSERWQRARDRWFWPGSSGALVLMLLWPVGLLFPAPLPLGLGISWARVQEALVDWLLDVPWAQQLLEWVIEVPTATGPVPVAVEALAMVLGLLGPCLLAFSITRAGWRRGVMAIGTVIVGAVATTFSTAMNFGPGHALGWLTAAVPVAWALGLLVALALVAVPQRLAAALGLVALSGLMALVAQAPADPFFSLSLQAWEQGRFIRFHGLAQWVGWLWPLAALIWLAGRLSSSEAMAPLVPQAAARGPGAKPAAKRRRSVRR